MRLECNLIACSSAMTACVGGAAWSIALQLFPAVSDMVTCCAAMTACERGSQWQGDTDSAMIFRKHSVKFMTSVLGISFMNIV